MPNNRIYFSETNYRFDLLRWWKKWHIFLHVFSICPVSKRWMDGTEQPCTNYIHSRVWHQPVKLWKSNLPDLLTIKFYEYCFRFTEILQNIRKRHSTVVETLAQVSQGDECHGIELDRCYYRVIWSSRMRAPRRNMKNHRFSTFLIGSICLEFPFDCSSINTVSSENDDSGKRLAYFLSEWNGSDPILLFLAAMCFGDEVPVHPTHLGFVDPNCHVEEIIKGNNHWIFELALDKFLSLDAFENAQFLCEGYYLTAPALELRRINGTIRRNMSHLYCSPFSAMNPNQPIAIAYVPSHLYHIMFELFKVSEVVTSVWRSERLVFN